MAKCKKVHIGIFFDGTGNNKTNDKESSSQSNIAKLSDLYIHGKKIAWILAVLFTTAMIYIGLSHFLVVEDEFIFIFYFALLIVYSILFYMLLKKNTRNIFLGSLS
jgi:hypothetical protein